MYAFKKLLKEKGWDVNTKPIQGYNIAHECLRKIPRAIEGHFPV